MPKNLKSILREYYRDSLDDILEIYTLEELWEMLTESLDEYDKLQVIRMGG